MFSNYKSFRSKSLQSNNKITSTFHIKSHLTKIQPISKSPLKTAPRQIHTSRSIQSVNRRYSSTNLLKSHQRIKDNLALVGRISKIVHRKSQHEFPIIRIQSGRSNMKSKEDQKIIQRENQLLMKRVIKEKLKVKSKQQIRDSFKDYEKLRSKLRKTEQEKDKKKTKIKFMSVKI